MIQSSAIDILVLSFGYMKIEEGPHGGEATRAALAEVVLIAGSHLFLDQGQGLGLNLVGALSHHIPVHILFQLPGPHRGRHLARNQKGIAADGA